MAPLGTLVFIWSFLVDEYLLYNTLSKVSKFWYFHDSQHNPHGTSRWLFRQNYFYLNIQLSDFKFKRMFMMLSKFLFKSTDVKLIGQCPLEEYVQDWTSWNYFVVFLVFVALLRKCGLEFFWLFALIGAAMKKDRKVIGVCDNFNS